MQQLRHGIFDLGKLLTAVGGLLREHCAPARDAMLDTMLAIAEKCRPGNGGQLIDALAAIRMCFELLEFMRLVSGIVLDAYYPGVGVAVQNFQKRQKLINFFHCISGFGQPPSGASQTAFACFGTAVRRAII